MHTQTQRHGLAPTYAVLAKTTTEKSREDVTQYNVDVSRIIFSLPAWDPAPSNLECAAMGSICMHNKSFFQFLLLLSSGGRNLFLRSALRKCTDRFRGTGQRAIVKTGRLLINQLRKEEKKKKAKPAVLIFHQRSNQFIKDWRWSKLVMFNLVK